MPWLTDELQNCRIAKRMRRSPTLVLKETPTREAQSKGCESRLLFEPGPMIQPNARPMNSAPTLRFHRPCG